MSTIVKPIKRNPALVEFSKDHHFGLLLVWKIRQGERMGIAPIRISNYVICTFDQDLAFHFADEEKYLFINLSPNDSLRLRAEEDHTKLRALIVQVKRNPYDRTRVRDFADLLEVHIRFEERELFNRLQSLLPEEKLLKLLNEIPARPHLHDTDWSDLFWVSNGIKQAGYAN